MACAYDVRTRRVPAWLTVILLLAGLALAARPGGSGIGQSLAGIAVGLLTLPFVLLGGLGAADALLLAGVGSWEGWSLALRTACWTAVAGGLIALGLRFWRGKHDFAYVPAIAIGFAVAALT
ncbi:MAG TPA: prepilin peptidase [Chloroflexota bacterium]|nr:prepilin peptidase [Chloroflexota bacterium]